MSVQEGPTGPANPGPAIPDAVFAVAAREHLGALRGDFRRRPVPTAGYVAFAIANLPITLALIPLSIALGRLSPLLDIPAGALFGSYLFLAIRGMRGLGEWRLLVFDDGLIALRSRGRIAVVRWDRAVLRRKSKLIPTAGPTGSRIDTFTFVTPGEPPVVLRSNWFVGAAEWRPLIEERVAAAATSAGH